MQNIKEKVVVITSASSGLGEPTAPSRYRRGKRCAGCATGAGPAMGLVTAMSSSRQELQWRSRMYQEART